MATTTESTDELYRVLHEDHEEVERLFEQILATDDQPRVEQIWRQIGMSLVAHSRVEAEVVYGRLVKERETKEDVNLAYEEHDNMERMYFETEAQGIGTEEFFAMATELEGVIRQHVEHEEYEMLPRASEVLSEDERSRMVERFLERKQALMPQIEQEIKMAGKRQGAQRQGAQGAQGKRAQGKSAQGKSAQSRGAQSRGAQSRGAQGKSAQGKSAQGKSAQGKSAQGKSAQGKSAQGKSAGGRSAQGKRASGGGSAGGQRGSAAERRRTAQRSGGASGGDLSERSVRELREMASQNNIRGRSKMGKRELVKALERG